MSFKFLASSCVTQGDIQNEDSFAGTLDVISGSSIIDHEKVRVNGTRELPASLYEANLCY
jgi:hypothetical protein